MLKFEVVGELEIPTDADLGPDPIFQPAEPMTERDKQLARYRHRNARYANVRRVSGFQGYSLRPGYDYVIYGRHVKDSELSF